MLIKPYNGKTPVTDGAYVAENVTLIGDVTLEPGASIWYGSVLRGDTDAIVIGADTSVQDNSVVHCAAGLPTVIGRGCVVGHNVILHSCTVEDGCLIGMGSTLLDGCHIGKGSIVAAGAVVSPHKVIPPNSMVMGVPGRVVRSLNEEDLKAVPLSVEHYRIYAEAQLERL